MGIRVSLAAASELVGITDTKWRVDGAPKASSSCRGPVVLQYEFLTAKGNCEAAVVGLTALPCKIDLIIRIENGESCIDGSCVVFDPTLLRFVSKAVNRIVNMALQAQAWSARVEGVFALDLHQQFSILSVEPA